MKAKTVNETNNFERGLDPKEAMGVGNKDLQRLKLAEVTTILKDRPNGRFYCLYVWEPDISENNYYTDPSKLLEDYKLIGLETIKDFDEGRWTVNKRLGIYMIKGPGRFYDERDMEGGAGVQVLFKISFEDVKIYY